MKSSLVKVVIQLLLLFLLPMIVSLVKKVPISRLKPVLDAWATVNLAVGNAMIDDELTVGESVKIQEKVSLAVEATVKLFRGNP